MANTNTTSIIRTSVEYQSHDIFLYNMQDDFTMIGTKYQDDKSTDKGSMIRKAYIEWPSHLEFITENENLFIPYFREMFTHMSRHVEFIDVAVLESIHVPKFIVGSHEYLNNNYYILEFNIQAPNAKSRSYSIGFSRVQHTPIDMSDISTEEIRNITIKDLNNISKDTDLEFVLRK